MRAHCQRFRYFDCDKRIFDYQLRAQLNVPARFTIFIIWVYQKLLDLLSHLHPSG